MSQKNLPFFANTQEKNFVNKEKGDLQAMEGVPLTTISHRLFKNNSELMGMRKDRHRKEEGQARQRNQCWPAVVAELEVQQWEWGGTGGSVPCYAGNTLLRGTLL